jgi:hypothetical protein
VDIKILMLSALATLPLVALPAMAQTNMPPADQSTTGTKTTQSGKTVEAPPQPPPGTNGGGQGQQDQ